MHWSIENIGPNACYLSAMRRLGLKGIGFLSAIVYAANALHHGWTPPAAKSAMDDLQAWLTILALLALYWAGYRRLLHDRIHSFREVIFPAIPLVAISFVTIPYNSTDVFLYIDAGWAQAHYGLNPYQQVLRDIPQATNDRMIRPDWMRDNKNPWLDLPFVYGFLFALLTKATAGIGRGYWWPTLALFKCANVVAYFVCSRLVWRLTKSAGDLRADTSLYLFAWSPLILQHHIANAHNDLLVGCLIVLAAYLMTTGSGSIWAPTALIASSMIKYVTLPLVPVSIWFVGRRNGAARAATSTLLAALAALLVSLPFLGSISTFRFDLISTQLFKTTAGSLYAFLFYLYRFAGRFAAFGSTETFGSSLKILLWFIGASMIGVEGYRFCRKREPSFEDWIAINSWIIFVIILIASSQFY